MQIKGEQGISCVAIRVTLQQYPTKTFVLLL